MKSLNLHKLEPIDHLAYPENHKTLDQDSSALEIFTDFAKSKPLVIHDDLPADVAENLMLTSHVKMKLVVNHNDEFVGLLSFDNLSAQRVMQRMSKGQPRSEIRVSDLMTRKADIQALDYQDLAGSSIAEVIQTLQKNGVQHCLVVNRNTHEIRGLISASDIARKLHLPISIAKVPSFVDIFEVIRH